MSVALNSKSSPVMSEKDDSKDVVVGSIFSEERSEETVHFSDKGLLFYNPNSDESQIKKQLMQLGNVRVFSRSSQVTQYYKEKTKDIER